MPPRPPTRRVCRLHWLMSCFALAVGTGSLVHAQDHATPIVGGRGQFRQLASRHLTLITDLPSSPEVDELPHIFDKAVEQWCEYFRVAPERVRGWHVRGFLMGHREHFRRAGFLPAKLPPFPHGFQRGDRLWVVEQPSDYYRRHLLLHEGTHAFMVRWLGGTGPPWYMEGIAELLATHGYHEETLRLNVIPADKRDVPEWGRIKIIRQAVAKGQVRSLSDVLNFLPRQFSNVEAYAWSWSVATFLDGHPQWHETFAAMQARVRWDRNRFNAQFLRDVQVDRTELEEAWQIFVDQLDYGYDVRQDQITDRPRREWHGKAAVKVESHLGWQSTGLMLQSGQRYRISASGRYRLVQDEPAWFSEAGGVTIRYHRGWPIGMLLAAVRSDNETTDATALVRPQPVGLRADLKPSQAGVLFLRINEPAGLRGDNKGPLSVTVQTLPHDPLVQPD